MIESIILYAAPVCAIRTMTELERVQTQFYKRLLGAPRCTPDYAIRIEVDVVQIKVKIFKAVLKWIKKY